MTGEAHRYVVRVLDDEEHRRTDWCTRVQACLAETGLSDSYEVLTISSEDWEREHALLHTRRERVRREERECRDRGEVRMVPSQDPPADEQSLLDQTDIFFVDYDLFDLSKESDLTGEIVSYLARCFSKCRYIVSVNQFEHNQSTFDLRMRGSIMSFADLNIAPEDMWNPNLWVKGRRRDEFCPWHWPSLSEVVPRHEGRVADLSDNLDHKILEWFGLNDATTMPFAASDFISGLNTEPDAMTFAGFADHSLQGLRYKDGLLSRQSAARICASRLKKWLDHTFVAGQEVLIDAPHLVSRLPSLLEGDFEDVESWNNLCNNEPNLKADLLESAKFPHGNWVNRPVWFGRSVRNNSRVEEIADPWTMKKPAVVFCEDASLFVTRTEAKQFVSDVESPHRSRFLKLFPSVRYVPAARLARK